jgi:hypothetical protein
MMTSAFGCRIKFVQKLGHVDRFSCPGSGCPRVRALAQSILEAPMMTSAVCSHAAKPTYNLRPYDLYAIARPRLSHAKTLQFALLIHHTFSIPTAVPFTFAFTRFAICSPLRWHSSTSKWLAACFNNMMISFRWKIESLKTIS